MAVENSIPVAGYTNGADEAFDYISENHERAGSALDVAGVAPGETVRIDVDPGQALRPDFDIAGATITRDGNIITIRLPNGGTIELAGPSAEAFDQDPPLLLQSEPVFEELKARFEAAGDGDEPVELTSAQDGTALEVPRPLPGETDEYQIQPGQTVILGFNLDEVEVLQTETDIVLIFGDGSQITLSALVGMALGENPPNFIEPGGSLISSTELLELAGDMTALAETLDGIETAAGGGDVAPVTNFGFGATFGDSGFAGGGGGQSSGTTPGGGGGGGGGGGSAAVTGGGPGGEGPGIDPPPPPPPADTIPEISAIPLTFGEDTLDVVIPPIEFPDALLSVDFGDDGAASIAPVRFAAATLTDLAALNLTSGGDGLSFELSADGTEIVATAGAPAVTVFVLEIVTAGESYSYSFDLQGPLDHATGNGANTLALPITVQAEDADGSTATASFDITVVDGMPKIVSFGPTLTAENVSVDEDDLAGASDGSQTTLVSGNLGLTGDLITLDYGADGPAAGAPDALGVGDFDLVLSGQPPEGLTSNGVPVVYSAFNPVTATITASAGGQTVFTVTLKGDGTYDFNLMAPLDHPAGAGQNSLDLGFTVTASPSANAIASALDADGDAVSQDVDGNPLSLADIEISRSFSVTVVDDVPSIADNDALQVEEASGQLIGGDLLASVTEGADGVSLTGFTYTDANGDVQAGTFGTPAATQFGTLTVNSDGTWSYTATNAADNDDVPEADGFIYTLTDADGDVVTAVQAIEVLDSGAPVVSAIGATVGEVDIADTAGQAIEVAFGADGAGSVTLADTTAALDAAGFTSNGVPVTFTLSNDGLTLTGSANGNAVVTVAISGNAADGFRYDATLLGALDHPAGDADLSLPISIVATDGDGTQTTAGASISITDDGPVAANDAVVVVEEASAAVGTAAGAANLLANDDLGADGGELVSFAYTDANGQPATAAAGSTVATQFGSLTVGADGTWSYTPGVAANNAGGVEDGFTYTVRDADGDEASATQGITITDSGAPVVSAIGATVGEVDIADTAGQAIEVAFGADGAGSVTLADTTTDLDAAGFTSNGVPVTFTLSNDGLTLTGSANGNAVVTVAISGNAADGFRYDATLLGALDHPAGDADLSLPISIVATDGDGTQTTAGASISITDDGPVAANDAVVVVEEASAAVGTAAGAANLLANDDLGADGGELVSFAYTDANGQPATAAAGSTVATQFGSLTVGADGTWSYTPGVAANNAGGVEDGFTYTVRDADGDEASATQGITITDSGAPVVSAIGATVGEADIADTAGQAIEVAFGADGAGSVTLADTTTDLDAAGFTSNGVPVTFTLSNDGLTLTGSANGNAVVTVAISGNAADGFRYDATLLGALDHPAGDADLSLPISIVATDGDGTQTTAGASISITDDGPVAANDAVVVVEEASAAVGTAAGAANLLANDDLGADGGELVSFAYTDANGQPATAAAGSTVATQFGSLTVGADGTWSYTPGVAANNAGGVEDGFTYTIRDADGDEASATQGITITDSGAPVVSLIGATVGEVDIADTAGQAIEVAFGADGAGSVTLADTTTDLDAAGFTSNGVPVTFTLSNDGLTLTGSANGNAVVTVAISGNAADGFRYDATLLGALDHPAGDADLSLPISIVATDGDGTQTTAGASISITDDGPVAANDAVVVVEEASAAVGTAAGAANLLANDDLGADGGELVSFAYTDANGQPATAAAGSTVATQFGSLTVGADGTWSYTPGVAANNAGGVEDGFTYTVRDADGDEASATQGITITDSGAPVVSAIGATVGEVDIADTAGQAIEVAFGADGAGSVTLADTTTDLDAAGFTSNGVPVTFTLSNDGLTLTGSANGNAVVTVAISGNAADGFRYDATLLGALDHPAGDADLSLPISIVATDGDGTQTTAGASISITDDGPVAANDAVVVVEEASAAVGTAAGAANLLANDDLGADGGELVSFAYTDANGQPATAAAGSTVATQFGSLTVGADGTWSYTPGVAANNAGGVEDGFTYTVRDADGDEASATQGITITDSGAPVVSAIGATVGEVDIADTAGQAIEVAFGADGAGSVTLADTTTDLDAAGFTSNGVPVTFTLSNDGLTLTGSANGNAVVTVAISGNAADGFRYDATLLGALDHPAGDADLSLPISIVATDGDGTQTTAGASISITDDGPVAANDAVVVVEEASAAVGTAAGAANLLANDDLGADGGELVSFAYTDANGQPATAAAGSTVATQFGSLTVGADGTWSYTPGVAANNAGGVEDGFTYTVRDADGDEASATQGITITDSGAPVVSAIGATVGEVDIADTAGQAIEVAFGADGAGSVTLADTTTDLDAAGFTSNGVPVTFTLSNDGLTLTGSANGNAVVTVAISGNAADGFRYDATLLGALDHPAGDADLSLPISIVATDGDGTQTTAGASISITDDGPVAANDAVVVVEEASAAVGTAAGAANLLANDDLGADGGELVSFAYTDANGQPATAAAGSTVATQFGSLTVGADGTWSYTPGVAANNAGGVEDGFTYTVRDADGDEASATQGITITDSGAPVVSAIGATVGEVDIADTAGQAIEVAFGADGAGSVTLADTTTDLDAAGFTSNGVPVTFTLSNDGLTLTGSANGNAVVTVAISGNAADGFRYDATLLGALDHPAGDADLSLPISIVATDGDGTQTTAGASISITDDGPVAANDATILVKESAGPIGTAQGAVNLLANDDMGADGGELASFTYTDANGESATADAGSTVATQYGTLTVNANGTWSYIPGAAPNNFSSASDGFTYTIRDADGDEATATQGITLTDDFAPVVDFGTGDKNIFVRLDEDDLATGTDGTGPTTVGDTILVKVGVDGLASVTIAQSTVDLFNQITLKSGGSDIEFTLSADGTVMTGTADGETILTVAVTGNPTDGFRFDATLSGPIDHFPGFGENSTGTLPLTFVATDGDGTTGQDRALLFIKDDVPTLTNDTLVTVAELGGIATTGNLLANADLGADDGNGLTVAGFTYTDDNGDTQQGVLGQEMDTRFGKLTVNEDGTWHYTADEAANQTLGPVGDDFTYSIADGDGDIVSAIQNIDIIDSGTAPVIDPEGGAFGGTVSELGLEDGPVVLTQQAEVAFGPDGPASEDPVVFSTDIVSTLTDRGLSSGGTALSYSLSEDGMTVTATANGETVFTIALGNVVLADAEGNATYDYTFTLNAPLDHIGAEGELIEGILFPVVITDGDGSQTVNDVTINVTDDSPFASDNALVSLQEGNYSVDGNVMDSVNAGADGGALVSFTYTDADGVERTASAGDTVQTQLGTLTVNADGGWSFDADLNAVGDLTAPGDAGFTYVIQDGDGDTATASQAISIAAPLDASATITVTAEGDEDAMIPLVITVEPNVETQFLQVVDVTISNLPTDVTLFDASGTEIAIIGGSATVGVDALQGLQIQRGANISNDIQDIQVTARVENIALGVTTELVATGTVVVHAVADDPTLTASATVSEQIADTDGRQNNGWGNGDDDAPGGSEFNNNAENAGGNDNNMDQAPGNSGKDKGGKDTTNEEAIAGTDDADVIQGNANGDVIRAGAGDDTVFGRGGDDDIKGDAGDDVIYGDHFAGTGDISFEISAGLTDLDGSESLSLTMSGLPDTGTLSNAQGDIIPIVAGTAVLTGLQLDGLVLTVDAEQPAFAVTIQAQSTDTDPDDGATDQSAVITRVLEIVPNFAGEAGDDTLQGGGGSDVIYGNAGNDVILGDGEGATSGNAAENLIVNGGFEAGQSGSGHRLDVPGWRVHQGQAEIRDASRFGVEDEGHDQVLDAEGEGFTKISQTVDGLDAGQALQLSFDMAGRTGRSHDEADGFRVFWNGTLVAEVTDVHEWETHTVDLIAGSGDGSDTLMFQGVGDWSRKGALLDNVALRTVTDTESVSDDDKLHGGAGNDDVAGNAGNDWIVGGTDNGAIDVHNTLDATFLSSSAGYNNTIGYYVKGEDGEPTVGKVLWANANNTARGDTDSIELDGFDADLVGYFLIPDGSRLNHGLSDGDPVTFGQNNQGEWVVEHNGNALNGQGFDAYYSDQALNPDGLDHVEEFRQNGVDVQGFEDLPNLGDNDFNDVMFSTEEELIVGNFAGGDDLWGGDIGGHGDGEKDVFFHAKGDGVDTIHDFEVGIDQLVLSGYDPNDVNFIADGGDTIIHLGNDDAVKLVGVSADAFAGSGGVAVHDADTDGSGALNVDELVSMKDDLFADEGGSNTPQSEDASVVFVAPIEPGILDGGNNNDGNV
jgi:T1SS-143 domain-containing protein